MINYINIHYFVFSSRINSSIPFFPIYYLYFTHLLLINSYFSTSLPSRSSILQFLSVLNSSLTDHIPHFLTILSHFIIKISPPTQANSSNTNFTTAISYSPILTSLISNYAFESKYYKVFNFPSKFIQSSFYFTLIHFAIFQFHNLFTSKTGSILFHI
jgi:hypothetical protein